MKNFGSLVQGLFSSKHGTNQVFHYLKRYKWYIGGCLGCVTIIVIGLIILIGSIIMGLFSSLDGVSGIQELLTRGTVLYQEQIVLIQEWIKPLQPYIQFFQ